MSQISAVEYNSTIAGAYCFPSLLYIEQSTIETAKKNFMIKRRIYFISCPEGFNPRGFCPRELYDFWFLRERKKSSFFGDGQFFWDLRIGWDH